MWWCGVDVNASDISIFLIVKVCLWMIMSLGIILQSTTGQTKRTQGKHEKV